MEPVLTPQEMRRADEATIAAGTPGFVLMDRAAYGCAIVALRSLGGAYGRRVVVVAGKGNNGGDGIAAAAHLARAGARVDTLLIAEPSGDPAAHLARARLTGARFTDWSPGRFDALVPRADLVVDAVFGTGFAGVPSGPAAEAIARMAVAGRPVLAVDIPSGVSGDDGSVAGATVSARDTVAIQSLKVGHVTGPGALLCGRVLVADVGIAVPTARSFVPAAHDVARLVPSRRPDVHKYTAGVVAMLAGSPGMTGAAALAARSATAAGAGMVFLGVPRSCLAAAEAAVTEAVKVPLSDVDGYLGEKAVDELGDRLARSGALALGPGIGRGPHAERLVRRALAQPVPVVADADALTALADLLRDEPDILRARPSATVLTPHEGEFARLAGRSVAPHERLAAAREAAARLGAIVHLKGFRAVTATPDGRAWVNPTGNPALATAGSGDVLTGVVSSLVAQGLDPADATWAGAFVHGLAGDVAAERLGRSIAASDVAAALPLAFRRVARAVPSDMPIRTALEDQ